MGQRGRRLRVSARASLMAVASLLGCVDLFHSTDFGGTCSAQVDGGCLDAAGVDAAKTKDGRADGGTTGPRDATADRKGGPRDVTTAVESAAPSDAGHEATGTNFCTWSSATAQSRAEHACLWLGACAGNADLNEFGTCYPNALLAYDCILNPNQQVRGPLHTYWDALWQATSCEDVLQAIFPQGVPLCTGSATGCGDGLPGDGGSYGT